MKLHYYPETDSLYIELLDEKSCDSKEIAEGVVIDLGSNGQIVGFDIDNAKKRVNLSKLEILQVPVTETKIA